MTSKDVPWRILTAAIIVFLAVQAVVSAHAEYRLTEAQKDERAQTIEKYCLTELSQSLSDENSGNQFADLIPPPFLTINGGGAGYQSGNLDMQVVNNCYQKLWYLP